MTKLTGNKTALVIFLEDRNRKGVKAQFSNALKKTDADQLYCAFLEDTILACLSNENYDVMISYHSGRSKEIVDKAIEELKSQVDKKSKDRLEKATPDLWEQASDNTAKNIADIFKHCFDLGFKRALLIDCVTPAISKQHLKNAVQILRDKEVVFGPTLEGSFYLLGMRKLIPEIFTEINWNDNKQIYSKMVQVADTLNLDWGELELWYNLRGPADLEFLARDINAFRIAGDEKSAKHTEKVLESLINKIHDEEF